MNGKLAGNNTKLPLYRLLRLISKEANLVNRSVRALQEGRKGRRQTRAHLKFQESLTLAWKLYERTKRVTKLLSTIKYGLKPPSVL